MARRQLKVFGVTIAATAVALALALLGVSGFLPFPYGEEFSKKITYAEVDDTPCPTEGATALQPDNTQIQVLNASSTGGLAKSVAAALEENGYQISKVDNSTEPFRGNVQIEVGPGSVDQAYSLARLFEAPVRIKMKELPANTITIVLGEAVDSDLLPNAEKIKETLGKSAKLTALPECLPANVQTDKDSQESGKQSGAQSSAEDAESAK